VLPDLGDQGAACVHDLPGTAMRELSSIPKRGTVTMLPRLAPRQRPVRSNKRIVPTLLRSLSSLRV